MAGKVDASDGETRYLLGGSCLRPHLSRAYGDEPRGAWLVLELDESRIADSSVENLEIM